MGARSTNQHLYTSLLAATKALITFVIASFSLSHRLGVGVDTRARVIRRRSSTHLGAGGGRHEHSIPLVGENAVRGQLCPSVAPVVHEDPELIRLSRTRYIIYHRRRASNNKVYQQQERVILKTKRLHGHRRGGFVVLSHIQISVDRYSSRL